MVDAGQRFGPGGRQPLPHADPNEEAAGQPGTSRDRDQVDVVRLGARAFQREVEKLRQALQVVARGELGDDPAEFLVELHLRVDDVGEDAAAVFHEGDGCFVAACFNAKG